MKYFTNDNSFEELKKQYRRLVKCFTARSATPQ